PGSAYGWKFALAQNLASDWFKRRARPRDWIVGQAPFVFDREFKTAVDETARGTREASPAVAFRYEFDLERGGIDSRRNLIVGLNSMDETLAMWINGRSVLVEGSAATDEIEASRKKSRDRGWWEFEVVMPSARLRVGRNVVAALVKPAEG